MTEDYYSVLDVAPSASEEAILRAYREKATDMHPDVSDDPDAEETFRRLHRAKSVLTDDQQRRRYDRLGHDRFVEKSAGEEPQPSHDSSNPKPSREESSRTRPSRPLSFDIGRIASFFGDYPRGHPGHRRSVGEASGRRWSQVSTEAGGPGVIDLRSLLRRPRRGSKRRNEHSSDEPRQDPADDGDPCPTCGGRGTIEHIIDTGAGRRRRRERCERCDGTGVF